jgi:hypothetical protein
MGAGVGHHGSSLGRVPATGTSPEFSELYDERTLAAIERGAPSPDLRVDSDSEPQAARRRLGLAGSLLTGMALALQDVYDPAPDEDAEVEFRPESGDPGDDWVTFVYVPGAPSASRLIVRPWLAPAGSLVS